MSYIQPSMLSNPAWFLKLVLCSSVRSNLNLPADLNSLWELRMFLRPWLINMQRFSLTVEWFRYCATFSSQAYELLEETLFDPSEKVAKTSREVFLPSFAAWAQDLDKVESHLFTSLISIVENALKVRCLFFKCLDTILDLTFWLVTEQGLPITLSPGCVNLVLVSISIELPHWTHWLVSIW